MKVILAFDYEEYKTVEDAVERSKYIQLKRGDKKKIFIIESEIPWPIEVPKVMQG